ncbi:hypothetical protein SELMODRAFT_412288 [Selaginella moellendorffii]|uniref:Uncharacterized protein n=1 Tax=Selaginella moellendorffii TaxID=88036 RepID=D8RKN5_SELML|nr:hypothetical protein SELMODRAFT_412288 [Selaginella moellendorffii]
MDRYSYVESSIEEQDVEQTIQIELEREWIPSITQPEPRSQQEIFYNIMLRKYLEDHKDFTERLLCKVPIAGVLGCKDLGVELLFLGEISGVTARFDELQAELEIGMAFAPPAVVVITFLAASARVKSVKADALVRQAQRTLQTSRMSSIVLGNAMMGSVLFSSIFPEANAITISTVCDGRLGFVHAATTFDGFTTGHVHNPSHSSHGNMIMATVVRECDMRLSISLSKSHRTFVSPMGPSREVAESLAYFLWKNQKMDTAASLAMKFDEHNIVKTARGFIIQVYPLSEKFACHQLRENIENSPSLADLDDTDARDIIEKLLHGIEPGSFSQRDLKFQPVGEEEQQRFLGQREKLFSSNQARTYEKMINNPTSQDFEETKLPPQHPSDLYKLANGAFTSKIGTTRRGPRRPEIRMPRMVHTPSRERSFKRHGGINEQEMTENGGERNGYCWMVSARERTTRLSMGYTSGTTTKSYVWFLTLKRIRVWNVVAVVGRSNVRLENAGPVKTRST